jgi:hypothetical protein
MNENRTYEHRTSLLRPLALRLSRDLPANDLPVILAYLVAPAQTPLRHTRGWADG